MQTLASCLAVLLLLAAGSASAQVTCPVGSGYSQICGNVCLHVGSYLEGMIKGGLTITNMNTEAFTVEQAIISVYGPNNTLSSQFTLDSCNNQPLDGAWKVVAPGASVTCGFYASPPLDPTKTKYEPYQLAAAVSGDPCPVAGFAGSAMQGGRKLLNRA